jgi:hypothetical protein
MSQRLCSYYRLETFEIPQLGGQPIKNQKPVCNLIRSLGGLQRAEVQGQIGDAAGISIMSDACPFQGSALCPLYA